MDIVTLARQIANALIARRKKWILLTTVLVLPVLTAAAYLVSREPPRYRTTATVFVEIRPDRTRLFRDVLPMRPLSVQMAILKSRSLAESVIGSLPQASLQDLIQNPYDRDYAQELQNWYRRLRGEEPVVESPQRRALDELQRARMTFVSTRDGIVQISTEASNPRAAQDIATTYIEVLISRTRSFNVDDTRTQREFLEHQGAQLSQALAASEEALRQFTLSRGGMKVPDQSAEVVSRMRQLEQTLAEVRSNKRMSESRLAAMRAKLEAMPVAAAPATPAAKPPPAPASASTRIQQLRTRLASLEGQLLEYEDRYTEQHPRVSLTRQQIATLQRELGDAVKEATPVAAVAAAARDVPAEDRVAFAETVSALETSLVSLGAHEDALNQQIASLRSSLVGLSKDELEFTRLTSEVQSNRTLRDALSSRLAAVRVREQGEMGVVRVIDPPSAARPAANTRRLRLLGAAVVLSLAIGVGLPAAVEYLNRPVESEMDVLNATGLPVLSIVPILRSRRTTGLSAGHPGDDARQEDVFMFTEAFRRLRVELQLLGRETELRRVLVASALPGEGKSTVVVNLAHAFGEVGKRVILADADFQRPTLHRTLKVNGTKGLSDMLAGTSELQDALSPVSDGVWLMPRGGSPGALTRTGLGSARLGEVLAEMASEADYVLLDSSPILFIPDNLYMAAAADGIVIVVQVGVTRPRDLVRTKEILEKSGTPIIGVVLNQMPLRRAGQYYGYYNRYYKAYMKAEPRS